MALEIPKMEPLPSPSPSPPRKRKRDHPAAPELEVDITAPEPPSKKALRKAKKGKLTTTPSATAPKPKDLPNAPSDSDPDEEDAPGKPPPTTTKRSDHGIWIGNLPWSTTKADLRTFLTKDTEITEEMITRIHMPAPSEAATAASRQKIKPQNKGFAYVDFVSASALASALALSETLLTGRRVLIKDSKSFEGRPEKPKDEGNGDAVATYGGKPPSKRVFVGNLGFETTKEDLKEHFERCGPVADVFVATFEDSGKCKGFAWVEFEDSGAGEMAVRGWVDWMEERQDEGEDEDEDGDRKEEGREGRVKLKKKPKPRKWWVNRLAGRPLKIEFAEDKAVRYKKRFGKDGTATKNKTGTDIQDLTEASTVASGHHVDDARESDRKPRPRRNLGERRIDARTVKPGAALAAASRLTGGIVPSLGKKIVF